MLPNHLLHPDDVVPAAELVAALVEMGAAAEAHRLVEGHAVLGQVRVGMVEGGDAGVHVEDALDAEQPLKFGVEHAP